MISRFGGAQRRFFAVAMLAALLCGAAPPRPNAPMVINLSTVPAARVASVLRSLYPNARITIDSRANAVIVVASPFEEEGMRAIATGIDVKNPTDTVVDSYQLKVVSPNVIAERMRSVFPDARFVVAPNHTVVMIAPPAEMSQIKTIVGTIDAAPPTPTPRPHYPAEAVRVTQGNTRDIARAAAAQAHNVRVSVSQNEILLAGPPDEVQQTKTLIEQLDVPSAGAQYQQVYRLRYVDATSVADLFRRTFPTLDIVVNQDLNAITITANITMQRRIADAIAQLDLAPQATGAGGEGGGGAAAGVVVVPLKAAVPGLQGGPSTSATDIATTVQQALQQSAPDLHIVVPPNSTELVLTGSPYSIKQAQELIAQLDQPQPLVAMDTEVLEIDEGVEKQLGLKFPTAALSTTFSELQPTQTSPNYTQPQLLSLQPLTRTPMSLGAELDFLISNNYARVLENPRITTITGRTASLRAGETVNILTTTGGGTGTVATTQVQSFQTGVTLDITPVVNDGDYITVTLHPSVNTIAGSSGTVPNIQTRDTTTTVGLHDGQTLVIGGLVEDTQSRTVNKIPFLGDIPLLGRALFQNTLLNKTRNELIVTVTPHIVRPGENGAMGRESTKLGIPRPQGLPTLPPSTVMPQPRRNAPQPEVSMLPSPAPEPAPTLVPTPTSGFTPRPPFVSPSPMQSAAQPLPVPSAFGQTNVYTFGSAPANNFAQPNQPPQIFFVQVSPSVIRDGQQMTISAITTTNVTRVTFGANAIAPMASLSSVGTGQWQSTFTFSAGGISSAQSSAQVILTATTGIGGTVRLPIPITIVSP